MIWLSAAHLAPEPITAELLMRLGALDPYDAEQREQGDLALGRLRRLGLLEPGADGDKIHRLLAAYALSASQDMAGDRLRAELAIVAEMRKLEDDGNLELAPARYRAHLEHLTHDLAERDDLAAAGLVQELGDVYAQQEDYATARPLYQRALDLRTRRLNADHLDIVESMHDLANALLELKEYAEARHYYGEALAVKERVLGREHKSTTYTLRQLGREHRSTAYTLNDLGDVAQAEGNYPAARRYYGAALAIRERVLGRDHTQSKVTRKALRGTYYSSAWLALGALIVTGVLGDSLEQPWPAILLVLMAIVGIASYWWHPAAQLLRHVLHACIGVIVAIALAWLMDIPSPWRPWLYGIGAGIGLFWPRFGPFWRQLTHKEQSQ